MSICISVGAGQAHFGVGMEDSFVAGDKVKLLVDGKHLDVDIVEPPELLDGAWRVTARLVPIAFTCAASTLARCLPTRARFFN